MDRAKSCDLKPSVDVFRVRLGLLLIVISSYFTKNIWYQLQTHGLSNYELQMISIGPWLDSIFLLIFSTSIFAAGPFAGAIGLAWTATNILLTIYYCIDTCAMVFFGTAMTFDYLMEATRAGSRVGDFLTIKQYAVLILAILIGSFLKISFKRRTLILICFVHCCLLCGLILVKPINAVSIENRIAEQLDLRPFPHQSDNPNTIKIPIEDSVPDTTSPPISIEFVATKRPIILVMIESLSAIDIGILSSNARSKMPLLERLSRDGVLFSNFFANTPWSVGGLLSVHLGTELFRYPGAPQVAEDSYAQHPSIIKSFNRGGYFTETLYGADLRIFDMGSLFSRLSFRRIQDSKSFPLVPRGTVFDGIHDAELYKQVLRSVDERKREKRPYLITAETMSTHEPFIPPDSFEQSEVGAFAYADLALYKFVDSLKERSFFNEGILIITGDHRKRAPVTISEQKLYGCSAIGRTPLLVLGKGFGPPRIDDRIFQQSDLFESLHLISDENANLSDWALYSDWYRDYSRKWAKFDVFKQRSKNIECGALYVSDTEIEVHGFPKNEAYDIGHAARQSIIASKNYTMVSKN